MCLCSDHDRWACAGGGVSAASDGACGCGCHPDTPEAQALRIKRADVRRREKPNVIYLDLTLRSGARLVVPLEGGEAKQLAQRLRAVT